MKIKFQILLLVWCVIAMVSALAFYRSYDIQKTEYISGIDAKLTIAAEMLPLILPPNYHDNIVDIYSVPEDDYLEIVDMYNRLALQLDLQYLWSVMVLEDEIVFTTGTSTSKDVSNGDHALFFDIHSDPGAFDSVLEGMEPEYSSFRNEWGDGRMVLIPHIDRQGRRYIFGASIGTEEVNQSLANRFYQGVFLFFSMLVLGMVLTFWVTRRMTHSIEKLTETAKAIEKGEYGAQFGEEGGGRELKSLGQSINVMSKAIYRHNKELEEIVKEKTNDLAEVNKSLEVQVAKRTRQLFINKQRLAGVLNLAPEAVIATDKDSIIQFFSRGAERIFGYEQSEIVGKRIEELLPTPAQQVHGKHVEEFISSDEDYRLLSERREIIGVRKGGETFPARASVSKSVVEGETLLTVVLYDITKENLQRIISCQGSC